MANAPPPMKVNRDTTKGQAPAAPASAHAPAAPYPPATPAPPPPIGPAQGVEVPRLEPTLPEGLRLGAFEIKGVIAHSRAAVIYRVSDHSLGIPAAIKEYMPVGVARRGNAYQVVPIEAWHEDTIDLGRRAFFAESRALARCDDPALLRVTQLWEINGTAYRVMPLYSGKRLVDLRRDMKAPIDETALRAMLERLLDALAAYHASAGVHGNVTPMNILMPALDRPVLLGPGKASMLLATELGEPVRSDFEAAFAAPEQHEAADAAVIGPSADLFGLAQTLRYGITGSAPIGHESLRASIHRLLGAGAVSNYSDALLDALSSATAAVPAERPQSLDEFRQRLRRLEAQSAGVTALAQAPGAAEPAPAVRPAPPPHAQPPVASHGLPPSLHAPEDDDVDETIDVSSVLGDLMQEPAEPPDSNEATRPGPVKPAREPEAEERIEPTLNFAFGGAVPPVHEPADHAPHAAPSPHVHADARQPQPTHPSRQPPADAPTAGYAAGLGSAPTDRAAGAPAGAPAYRTEMYDDAEADPARFAESYRPKRSLLASPVLRMSVFVVGISALAILVILGVSGVWDPRGPALNLPSSSSSADTTLNPPPPPSPTQGIEPAKPEPTLPPARPSAVAGPTVTAPRAEAPAPAAAATEAPTTAPAPTASAPTVAAAPASPGTRESSSTRRRAAAQTEAASDPRESCAGRTQFALYRCMQAQCARSRWAAHPECVRLRKSDRVDPP
jgi:serine/threonine protein kinase